MKSYQLAEVMQGKFQGLVGRVMEDRGTQFLIRVLGSKRLIGVQKQQARLLIPLTEEEHSWKQ